MNTISFEVNNQRKMKLVQRQHDGATLLVIEDQHGDHESIQTKKPSLAPETSSCSSTTTAPAGARASPSCEEVNTVSEEIIQDGLWYLLARFYGFEDTVLNKVAICKTLKDAGISDTDKGVLIQMEDGSEFQLIIKQTAKYDPAYYERPDTPIH